MLQQYLSLVEMFFFLTSYKVIVLIVWLLYEIQSQCVRRKNKYIFEIGTSSLTAFRGVLCAFGISLTSGSGEKPKASMALYILFIKILWNRLTSFVHYLLLFHLPLRGVACTLMNILKVAYFWGNENIDVCSSASQKTAFWIRTEKLQ